MEITLYLCQTKDFSDAAIAALEATLPPPRAEQARAAKRREAYLGTVLGFCLVRHAARGLCPEADTEHWELSPHGKPHLPGHLPHFSLAHTNGAIAVAVCKNAPVGVDLELLAPHRKGILSRVCTPSELARVEQSDPEAVLRLWCAKEARGKELGVGLRDPKQLDVSSVAVSQLTLGNTSFVLALSPAKHLPPPILIGEADLSYQYQPQ